MQTPTATPVDTPTPGKRGPKPARPVLNRDVDKAAAQLKEKYVLPEPPGKQINWDQMQEYFKLLTPEMWTHVAVYLYRLKPRIIRQLVDPNAPNYIDCLGEPFTMEYMIQRHGGGKYMLEVVSLPGTHLFRCYFEIDQVRHEPKLPNYEELDLNHRDNMSYIQMLQYRGVLDNKGKPVQNQQQQQQNGAGTTGVNTEFLKEILGFVSKMTTDQQAQLRDKIAPGTDPLTKSIGEILVERMRQDDPSKQFSTIQSVITAFKEMNKGSDMTPVFDRMVKMQNDYSTTVIGLVKEIAGMKNQQQPQPATNPPLLDQVDKLLDVMDKLSVLRGGGGGRRSGWDVGLDYAREIGIPLLGTLNNWMALRGGQPVNPMPVPGAAAPPAPTGPFDPYANPAALRAHASTLTQQTPPAGTPPTPGNELLAAFQQYGNLVINALNNGTPGYEFADYICGLVGTGVHAMFASKGEDTLVSTALMIPEFAMFGEARIRTFAHEFCHYQEFDEENAEAEATV